MKRYKLLLLVDDWELLERYEERFSTAFEVYCAPLGAEGLRLAREKQPDFILLNLAFENMTNQEAWVALRADPLTQKITIAAVGTGGSGPDYWLKDPVSVENIAELISRRK